MICSEQLIFIDVKGGIAMERCIVWKEVLVAVVLQPEYGDPRDGFDRAMKIPEAHLKDAVESMARNLGLTSSSYEETIVSVEGEANGVRGWNITDARLLKELIQRRKDDRVSFNFFYRRCNGEQKMRPGSDFFTE